MIVPIRRLIRNKKLISLLESQFSSGTEIGIELVESEHLKRLLKTYRVYTKHGDDEWSRDRFIIEKNQ